MSQTVTQQLRTSGAYANKPLDERATVATFEQLQTNFPGAYVGLHIYVEDRQTEYVVTKLDGTDIDMEHGLVTLEEFAKSNPNSVLYTKQTLTDAQKTQARQNIGAGTSNFSGSYNDLTEKPTIPDISGKVDKIQGKVLSTNDYTDEDKQKVDNMFGVPVGASEDKVLGYKNGAVAWVDKPSDGQDGPQGPQGSPGHNPCLGRFNSLPTLSPNPFPDALDGDYILFDTVDQQTSDPITYAYYFDGSNWSEEGTVVNPNHIIFNTGQDINAVKIKNDLEGGVNDVLSAEQGKTLNTAISNKVDKVEGKSLIDAAFASQVAVDSTTVQREMVYAILDNNGRLLFGVNKSGDFVFGKGKKTVNDIVQEAVDISVSKMSASRPYGMDLINGLTVGRNMYSPYEDKTPNEVSVNIPEYLYCLVDKDNIVIDIIDKQGKRL